MVKCLEQTGQIRMSPGCTLALSGVEAATGATVKDVWLARGKNAGSIAEVKTVDGVWLVSV